MVILGLRFNRILGRPLPDLYILGAALLICTFVLTRALRQYAHDRKATWFDLLVCVKSTENHQSYSSLNDSVVTGNVNGDTPEKLTLKLKMDPWKRRCLLEFVIVRCHVSFQGYTIFTQRWTLPLLCTESGPQLDQHLWRRGWGTGHGMTWSKALHHQMETFSVQDSQCPGCREEP